MGIDKIGSVDHYYFDHNATTPVSSEALSAMTQCLAQVYGNASSIHYYGQLAKQKLELSRRQVATLVGCDPKELVFTAGGTEADNLALLGTVRRNPGGHLITTEIEHPAVLNCTAQLEREGFAVTRVAVSSRGVVYPKDIEAALRPNTLLISVMHANNELGTLQPVAEIARIAHDAGALLHVDGVQALGKIPIDVRALGADLYSISAHKIYGPKGVGALYIRNGVKLLPASFGGHHERDRRAGTENVPGIVGFGMAAERAQWRLAPDGDRIGELRDRLENAVLSRIPETAVNGGDSQRTPNTTNIRFDGVDGEALVIALDLRGFAVSTGSACSSGAITPSHVLTAIGLTADQARSSIRFSLGESNSAAQVDALVGALEASVAHLRRISVHA